MTDICVYFGSELSPEDFSNDAIRNGVLQRGLDAIKAVPGVIIKPVNVDLFCAAVLSVREEARGPLEQVLRSLDPRVEMQEDDQGAAFG